MPDPRWHDEITDASTEASDARERLRNTIIAARADGMTLREIAEAAGVSAQRVHQITGRKEQP